jgi:hypothetical protein
MECSPRARHTTNPRRSVIGAAAVRAAALGALAALPIALATAAPAGADPAATPTPMPFHLVKLPNGDYTIPLKELEASGTSGMVTLHPSGVKTLVSVTVYGNGHRFYRLHLHPGSDCLAASQGTAMDLTPTFGGQRSQTLVSLPITNLTSKDYVVDVHDATVKNQATEACAPLR